MDQEEDPLGLRNLGIRYDYLMYKIEDRMSQLAEDTFSAVQAREAAVEDYLKDQLQVEREMAKSDKIIGICAELELEFMKLDQLESFVAGFKDRLDKLDQELNNLEGRRT